MCVPPRDAAHNLEPRTQPTVTLSTAEAEMYAMGMAAQEAQFIQHIPEEKGMPSELK